MQYSSHVKEQRKVGVGVGRKMDGARAQRFTRVMTVVRTCLGQKLQ